MAQEQILLNVLFKWVTQALEILYFEYLHANVMYNVTKYFVLLLWKRKKKIFQYFVFILVIIFIYCDSFDRPDDQTIDQRLEPIGRYCLVPKTFKLLSSFLVLLKKENGVNIDALFNFLQCRH